MVLSQQPAKRVREDEGEVAAVVLVLVLIVERARHVTGAAGPVYRCVVLPVCRGSGQPDWGGSWRGGELRCGMGGYTSSDTRLTVPTASAAKILSASAGSAARARILEASLMGLPFLLDDFFSFRASSDSDVLVFGNVC